MKYILNILVFVVLLSSVCSAVNPMHGSYYSFRAITVEEGLSHNRVNDVCQDERGFIWIATSEGLNRYDGNKVIQYKYNKSDSLSLSGNDVRSLFCDSKGRLWVGAKHLQLYDPEQDNFLTFYGQNTSGPIDVPYNIVEGAENLLWVISYSSGLCQINLSTSRVTRYKNNPENAFSISQGEYRKVFVDSRNNVWIGTRTSGLDLFNPRTLHFHHFRNDPNDPKSLQGSDVYEIYEDRDHDIWIGTFNSGLNRFDWKDSSFVHYTIDTENDYSGRVRAIFEDPTGNLLIGTRGGIYMLDSTQDQFLHIAHTQHPFSRITHNSVQSFFMDRTGGLWVGTFAGGVNYANLYRKPFISYVYRANDNSFLNDKSIYAIFEDEKENLWIGTEQHGLNFMDAKSGKFTYYSHGGNKNAPSYNDIKSIVKDDEGYLWIGTNRGGLDRFDPKTQSFIHYKHDPSNPNSLADNTVFTLMIDLEGNLWVGSYSGASVKLKGESKFENFKVQMGEVHSLLQDNRGDVWANSNKLNRYTNSFEAVLPDSLDDGFVFASIEDSRGNLWFGSRVGMVRYCKADSSFLMISSQQGFVSDYICAIAEDGDGNLWVSTLNGLVKYVDAVAHPEAKEFRVYTGSDGLQSKQFNYGSFYKSKTGRMYFGGINGITSFYPDQIVDNPFVPEPIITSLKIFNEEVKPNRLVEGELVLQRSILEVDSITLSPKHAIFTIGFTATHYSQPKKNMFAYKLAGFEDKWNYTTESQRFATYTNIPAGEYAFELIAANPDGVWNDKAKVLHVTILPPFWRTWWFKLLGGVMMCLISFAIVLFFIKLEKVKHDLVFEKIKAKKIHELDMIKMQFFTNISHEVKTPLSLIISPLEKMIKQKLTPAQVQSHLQLMHRNAIRLFNTVNQLLDYRKLEAGKLTINLKNGDIVHFVKDIFDSFCEVAEERKLKMIFHAVLEELFVAFDADKLQKVIYNLVSNAFKYTPDRGTITIRISLIADQDWPEQHHGSGFMSTDDTLKSYIAISVKDTGIGIDNDKLNKVFERFYQNENTHSFSSSTGIGLSLAKELIKLHNGHISVESKKGEGSEFIVHLPVVTDIEDKEVVAVKESSSSKPIDGSLQAPKPKSKEGKDANLPIVLVVEDNRDMIGFIKSNLIEYYEVLEAFDGESGLVFAREQIPDLIISDVMMPKMDGVKFSKAIKGDFRTSHIPIIMLTALSSQEHQKQGILAGVEEYITKPFDHELLLLKVAQILATRKMLREKYSREVLLQPSEIAVDSLDEKFLRKAIKIGEEHMANPDFGIAEFCTEIGVSRMQLYRKIKALTNMTVKEFVRSIRIKRAAQLLGQKQYNVSEIALMVGFKHVGYFRECFKKAYGVNPTEYVHEKE